MCWLKKTFHLVPPICQLVDRELHCLLMWSNPHELECTEGSLCTTLSLPPFVLFVRFHTLIGPVKRILPPWIQYLPNHLILWHVRGTGNLTRDPVPCLSTILSLQKDFSTSFSSTIGESVPSVSDVKCSVTNFPSEISVPFETNSHSNLTDRVLLMSSCTFWKQTLSRKLLPLGIGVCIHCSEGAHRYHGRVFHPGTKSYLSVALSQTTDTIWMFTPLLKTGLTWEGVCIRLEEPLVFLPWDHLILVTLPSLCVPLLLLSGSQLSMWRWPVSYGPGWSRSIIVIILFHTTFCIHFPDVMLSHWTNSSESYYQDMWKVTMGRFSRFIFTYVNLFISFFSYHSLLYY